MRHMPRNTGLRLMVPSLCMLSASLVGCGPDFHILRRQGQYAMLRGDFAPARFFLIEADRKRPRVADNLHDLGVCSVMIAKERFAQLNHAAAFRELDRAIAYYKGALDARPGHQASREGLNIALELKGQFDEALKQAQWAARFVGPSSRQQVFLAQELEERGDVDGALLRYRQAVAMEPRNPQSHIAIAKFLLRHDNEVAALHHLQAAYRLDPKNSWVAEQLAIRGATPQLARQSPQQP